MSEPLSLPEARALAERHAWASLLERGSAGSREALPADPDLRALYADACRRTGRAAEALEVAEALEPVVRLSGRRDLLLNVANIAGMALLESGRIEAAIERFVRLLEDAAAWEDQTFVARAANNLGVIANIRGDRDAALGWYQRALAAYQAVGNTRGLAQTHHNVGITYRDLGLAAEADAHHRYAIDLARGDGNDDVIALAELGRAELCLRMGDAALADALARRAATWFRRAGDPLGRTDVMRVRAIAAHARGRRAAAHRRFSAALRVARRHEDLLLLAEVLRDHGRMLRELGQIERARESLREAAVHYEKIGAEAESRAVRHLAEHGLPDR